MIKPGNILRQTTVAAIKRKAIMPHQWELTRLYETDSVDVPDPIKENLSLMENELPVASTIAKPTEWTLVTTKKVIGRTSNGLIAINIDDIEQWSWGDFKGKFEEPTTKMSLTTADGQKKDFIIESGKASMVIIYAIKTLQQLSRENQKNGS